jgi:ankyrin repeat protein
MRFVFALSCLPLIAASAGPGGLTEAVQAGDHAAIAALIDKRVDVNKPEPDGTTALQYAAHLNDLEAMNLLLRAGAKASAAANDYGVTAISEAAATGNPALVGRLLNAGGDANTVSGEGETVLMTAARTGKRCGC